MSKPDSKSNLVKYSLDNEWINNRQERAQVRKSVSLNVAQWIVFELSSRGLVMLLLALTVLATERSLDVGTIFIAYGMYSSLKVVALQIMPSGVLQMAEGLVVVRRIQVGQHSFQTYLSI